MKKPSLVMILSAFLVAVGLACMPTQAMGPHHGRGSHGGGFHGGGLHGGGFHGGGFHGSSRGHSFNAGGHFKMGGHANSFHAGRGFRSSGGGRHLFSSQGFRGNGGGSGFSSGRAFDGGRNGRISARNFRNSTYANRMSGRRSSAAPFRNSHTAFSSSLFRNGATNGRWESFGAGRYSSFASMRSGSSSVGEGAWRSFGNRGNSSFASARSGPWATSRSNTWAHESFRAPMTRGGWTTFSRGSRSAWGSNRLSTSRGFSNSWSRPSGSAISTDRVLSNFQDRFSHSPARRFEFNGSQFNSRSWSFDRSGFGDRRGFYGHRDFGGDRGFGGRDFWSGGDGDGFSFFPDLFGLAMDLAGFGLRTFNFIGAGLNLLDIAFSGDAGYEGYNGYGGYDNYGGFGGYGYDPGFSAPSVVMSPYWIPAPLPYAPGGAIFYPR